MSISVAPHLPYEFVSLKAGNRVAYLDKGQGPYTIVFLHGLATYSGTWMHNIEVLQHHFRCVALDFPGNGYSEQGDFQYGMGYYAQVVQELIEVLGLRNVVLCGHSMGGQVALTLALASPQLIEKMLLCAPAGFEHFNFFEQSMYHSALGLSHFFGNNEEHLRDMIHSSFVHNPFQADPMLAELTNLVRQYPPHAYKKMLDASIQSMLSEPVLASLGRIKTPTLVIFGEMDALIPNRLLHPYSTSLMAKDAVSRMPNAQLVMIPNAGHFVQWEKSEEVNKLIVTFMKTIAADR